MYMYTLCIKKMNPKSLVVVGMPLSSLIDEQLNNSFKIPVLTLSMGAKLKGNSVEAHGQPSLAAQGSQQHLDIEEACSGKFGLLFGHPEAFASEVGQKMLRRLSDKLEIAAVMVDEVHQGMFITGVNGLKWD